MPQKTKSKIHTGFGTFARWKKKLDETPPGGNFRQRAEGVGVPPEKVKDFKYWLRGQREQHEQREQKQSEQS